MNKLVISVDGSSEKLPSHQKDLGVGAFSAGWGGFIDGINLSLGGKLNDINLYCIPNPHDKNEGGVNSQHAELCAVYEALRWIFANHTKYPNTHYIIQTDSTNTVTWMNPDFDTSVDYLDLIERVRGVVSMLRESLHLTITIKYVKRRSTRGMRAADEWAVAYKTPGIKEEDVLKHLGRVRRK